MRCPLRVEVVDKSLKTLCEIGDPTSVKVTPRHNALSTGVITVDGDHYRTAELRRPGAAIHVWLDDEWLCGGPIRTTGGKGPRVQSVGEYPFEDYARLLWQYRGWPYPAGPADAQGSAGEEWTMTGRAETVVKAIARANITQRAGIPLAIAADQGRGGQITVTSRMHAIADRIFPAATQAGIGVQVRPINGVVTLDCYTPMQRPALLSEASGVVTDWEWSTTAPDVTRGVGGGTGQGTYRMFRAHVDTAAETLWGPWNTGEWFDDQRNIADPATLLAEVQQSVTEGAAATQMDVTLVESDWWRYGRQVRVGDSVRVQIDEASDPVWETVTEAPITWDQDGYSCTVKVGSTLTDPYARVSAAIASLNRRTRNLEGGQ